jgi:hypothetical protein
LAVNELSRSFPWEGPLSGEGFVEQESEGVDVDAVIDSVTEEAFRGHLV